jgi:hypothetical protein
MSAKRTVLSGSTEPLDFLPLVDIECIFESGRVLTLSLRLNLVFVPADDYTIRYSNANSCENVQDMDNEPVSNVQLPPILHDSKCPGSGTSAQDFYYYAQKQTTL